MKLTSILPITAGILIGAQAQAALLSYENFDYTAGTYSSLISTETPGYYSAYQANNDNFEILSTSLSSSASPFASSGGSFTNVTGAGFLWDNYRIGLNTGIGGTDVTTIYMSYLVQLNGNLDSRFQLTMGDVDRLGTGIFNDGGTRKFYASANGANPSVQNLGAEAVADTTYFIIAKMEFGNGSDTISMSTYGPSDSAPNSEPLTWDLTATNNVGLVNTIRLDIYDATGGAAVLDELRFGTTFNSVAIPEPSSIGLIAGLTVLVGLGARRRRRN